MFVRHLVSGSIQLRGEGKQVVMRRGGVVGVTLGRQGCVEGGFTWDSGCWPGLWTMEGFSQSCGQDQVTRKRGALGLMLGGVSESWLGWWLT